MNGVRAKGKKKEQRISKKGKIDFFFKHAECKKKIDLCKKNN